MARRFDQLYDQVTDFSNLYRAFKRAAKGKRGKADVAAFELDVAGELWQLQRELARQSYRPGGYRSFYIRDPKRRLISAAPFRDRVVHHALCQVIEPLFENTFIGDSYANRKDKGNHAALDRAQQFAKRLPFVLQCDIREFFPSIDHEVLHGILARKLADGRILRLCERILESGQNVLRDEYTQVYFSGDDLMAAFRPRGLPIGNLTSQFWANVYLNELDQFVKRELHCRAYVRYVDDFLLYAQDKRQLWCWKGAISDKLAELRLRLHARESTVYPVNNGIPFLGFRVYPSHRRLKRRNGVNFARRLRRNYRAYGRGELDRDALDNRVAGWIAHARHGDTWGLRSALLAEPLPRPPFA